MNALAPHRASDTASPMIEHALRYASYGWPVLPIDPGRSPQDQGKSPLVKGGEGFQNASTDPAQIKLWWSRWPRAMVGIATGRASGLFVLDLDVRDDGRDGIKALEELGEVPETVVALTPSGGRHLYFRYDPERPIGSNARKIARGIDHRGDRGLIIAPPSVRYDGKAYQWDNPPELFEPAPVPGWVYEAINGTAEQRDADDLLASWVDVRDTSSGRYGRAALDAECDKVASAPSGCRNQTLNIASLKIAQLVAGGHVDEHEARASLMSAARASGLDRGEIAATINSGFKAGLKNPRHPAEQGRQTRPANDGPAPLFAKVAAQEPYPVDALGERLAPAAEAIARKCQVPPAMACQSVLAAASLAAQALADVRIPSSGQRRPLSLFMLTVARSGDRKSTSDNEASRPIKEREKDLHPIFEAQMIAYRDAKDAWDAERRKILMMKNLDLGSRREKLERLGPEPARPLYPYLTAPEPTIEGLVKNWPHAHASLGIFSAEGAQFIGGYGMSQENRLRTAAGYSEMWDGSVIKRVRSLDGVSILRGRRLALHLLVQPEAANTFLSDPVLRDQGLLSRVLVAAPDSIAGTREYAEATDEDERVITRYTLRLKDVLSAKWPLVEGTATANELDPPVLTMSAEAKAAWIAFYNEVERQQGNGGKYAALQDVASKMAENAARIAGILTIVGLINATEISGPTMQNAVTLARWYLNEAARMQADATVDPALKTAQRLLEWMQEQPERPVPLAKIMRSGPRAVRNATAATEAVDTLKKHGWLIELDGKPRRFVIVEESA